MVRLPERHLHNPPNCEPPAIARGVRAPRRAGSRPGIAETRRVHHARRLFADRFTAGTVAVGGSATGVIETAHEQGWFAVELVAGRTYQFGLGGSPSGGGTLRDTYLRAIYDSEGRYQSGSYNDDFGGSRDSRVTFTASQSGTYYVRASGGRDETGSYTLRVSDVTPGSVEDPPPPEPETAQAQDEPEAARAAAEDLGDITQLAAPLFPRGTLDGAADAVTWYRFTLSEAREVGLGLRRQDADADLVLEDAAGNELHSSANDGTANEWVRKTLLAGWRSEVRPRARSISRKTSTGSRSRSGPARNTRSTWRCGPGPRRCAASACGARRWRAPARCGRPSEAEKALDGNVVGTALGRGELQPRVVARAAVA